MFIQNYNLVIHNSYIYGFVYFQTVHNKKYNSVFNIWNLLPCTYLRKIKRLKYH